MRRPLYLATLFLPLLLLPEHAHSQMRMRPPAPEVTFPEGVTSVEVPFHLEGHLIAFPVRANGRETLEMILDTGASGMVLFQSSWIERLGLNVLGEARVAGGGTGEAATATIGGPIEFDINGLRIKSDMIVAGVGEDLPGVTWNGALGAGLLARTVAEIDYEHSILRFHDPAHFEMPADAVVIPTELLSSGIAAVEAEITIDGVTTPRWLALDTGAFHALALHAAAGELPSRRLAGEEVLGYGSQGPLPGHVGVVDSFRLGSIELTDVVTTFPGPEGLRGIHRMTGDDAPVTGNLGSAILRQYTVIVDHPGKRLGLRPRSTSAAPFNFTTTGLLSRPGTTEAGYPIERVLPSTPAADAGLQPGDIIVTLNGETIAGRGLAIRAELMDPPPGTELELTYLRDGVEMRTTLVARPLFGSSSHG